MTLKKYTISLNGLLGHESIIFKLICSVSERTKDRTNSYTLITDNKNAEDKIKKSSQVDPNDLKRRKLQTGFIDQIINRSAA